MEKVKKNEISLDGIYAPSEDVVARDVQGELIIVPITSGVGNLEDEIFTFNNEGRQIWERLDGKKGLGEIAKELISVYDASLEEIEKDILGITDELVRRKMLVRVR